MPYTIELDDRRRAPLAKIARSEDTTFLVEIDSAGRIVLTPAVTISKDQLIFDNHSEMRKAVDAALTSPRVRRTYTKRG